MACKTNYQNTGKSRCQLDWMLIKKVIAIPYGTEFTGSDIDSWIMAGIHNADPAKRFYPMPDFTGIEDNSTEGSTYTSGYGQETPINDGLVGFTQTYTPDVCLQNRIKKGFNDNLVRSFLIIDSANKIWGVKTSNGLKGFTGKMFPKVSGATMADSISEPTIAYRLTVATEMENKWFEESDLTAEELDGLLDITLTAVTESTNLVITFSADGCGNEDVTPELATLGGVAACWLVGDSSGYEPISTAPTYDATKNVFKVASNTVSTGKTLKLAAPDVLYANGVSFKECVRGYTAQ